MRRIIRCRDARAAYRPLKYIRYCGIWDSDELYDLQEDPQETTNLINNPERKATIAEFNKRLFDEMTRTDGMSIPLFRDSGGVSNKRNANKGKAADFPDELKVKKQ
jgi:N-acetylglucosamine-6-sulfatase